MIVVPHSIRNAYRILSLIHVVMQSLEINKPPPQNEAILSLITSLLFFGVVLMQTGNKWNKCGFFAHIGVMCAIFTSLLIYLIQLRVVGTNLVEGDASWFIMLIANPLFLFAYLFYLLGIIMLQVIARDTNIVLSDATERLA